MFWAGFAFGRRTELVLAKGDPTAKKGGFTKHKYIEILGDQLVAIYEPDMIFM